MKIAARTKPGRKPLLARLGTRSIVFVGLMGAGKTAIGRKVAAELGLPFLDSDQEIESGLAHDDPRACSSSTAKPSSGRSSSA